MTEHLPTSDPLAGVDILPEMEHLPVNSLTENTHLKEVVDTLQKEDIPSVKENISDRLTAKQGNSPLTDYSELAAAADHSLVNDDEDLVCSERLETEDNPFKSQASESLETSSSKC